MFRRAKIKQWLRVALLATVIAGYWYIEFAYGARWCYVEFVWAAPEDDLDAR